MVAHSSGKFKRSSRSKLQNFGFFSAHFPFFFYKIAFLFSLSNSLTFYTLLPP